MKKQVQKKKRSKVIEADPGRSEIERNLRHDFGSGTTTNLVYRLGSWTFYALLMSAVYLVYYSTWSKDADIIKCIC